VSLRALHPMLRPSVLAEARPVYAAWRPPAHRDHRCGRAGSPADCRHHRQPRASISRLISRLRRSTSAMARRPRARVRMRMTVGPAYAMPGRRAPPPGRTGHPIGRRSWRRRSGA